MGEVIDVGATLAILQRRPPPLPARRIWSHAYFETRLAEECARAERAGTGFAVVRLRWEPGARGIVEAATTELRSVDVVGRYAPEEVEALLPDLAADAAASVVGALFERLATHDPPPRMGVALFPRDGRDPDSLLERAAPVERGAPSAPTVVVGSAMHQLRRLVDRIADSHISVLIMGETGVGKELLADTIHRRSKRAERPFLRLSCAALSESLLESELFGHERGAFTGAVAAKPGLLETADGGTVFLDEVGELPMSLQVKLLRVLEERQVLRVGALKPRPVDMRFVAATNRDLESEVARGTFRQDLFFRLNGVALIIPPLRERVGEIAGLAAAFAEQVARAQRIAVPRIAADTLAVLERYAWPGNIRELKNAMERAVLLCGGDTIRPEHLPLEKMTAAPTALPARPRPLSEEDELRSRLVAAGRERILDALERCAGNQTKAARVLGISRNTLMKKMDACGIPRPRKPE
jgi:DNA-binding NtrC family response regulator